MDQKHIRNFCIIAHIDHGKSTLADRFLDLTKTVEKRKMQDQMLDTMSIERERGITIKMQPVRMTYKLQATGYELNLIDTPGHVDFGYEVSRSLAAVEGAVLLVDCTKGVQAQTLANLEQAQKLGLAIIPAVNKIDLPNARVAETKTEIAKLLGIDESEVLSISGKTGEGVPELLERIVKQVPAPKGNATGPLKALIFDAEELGDFRLGLCHARVGQVYLVDGGDDGKPELLRLFQISKRLRLHALGAIHQQHRPFHGGKRARHFVAEVHMAGSIDQIKLVAGSLQLIGHADRLHFDGDAAFALDGHRVEHLVLHLPFFDRFGQIQKPVRQRGLAVIDVRDDAEITDVFLIHIDKRIILMRESLRLVCMRAQDKNGRANKNGEDKNIRHEQRPEVVYQDYQRPAEAGKQKPKT